MLSIRRSLTLAKEPKDSFLLLLCNLRARFVSTDNYDPPFSPLSKPTKPSKEKKKKMKTQEDQSSEPVNNPKIPVISDLPFDFRYSYSETNPAIEPIGFREPKRFSPFGPGRLDRKWTGTSALASPEIDQSQWAEERARVLGEPLTEEEVTELVERHRHSDCSRQINLGKGGVTHNMIDDIHNHWKKAEAVRIKCLGVPTLDMDNICFHLEEKSGGKIVYRHINVLVLYRGRNYDPKNRPIIPLMLWKPYPPIYPRLVKNVAEGLTFEETKEMRNRGLHSPALMKLSKRYIRLKVLGHFSVCFLIFLLDYCIDLARNGVYVNVVGRVREEFETEDIVRLDCTHVGMSDCKRIGVKLKDLVPCVPILFKDDQIILWRGKRNGEEEVFTL